MDRPNIKAILFDMGNVLLFFDARRSSKAFSEALGVEEEKLWEAFFISKMEKAYTRGEISSEEFFRQSSESFPGGNMDFKTFAHLWSDIFTENESMNHLLERLKEKYKLYLISNTNELHYNHIRENFNILRHFDKCFPSHEVGHRKPDPKMFEHVLEDIQLKAGETVFVDDIQEFVDSSKAVGINGVLFEDQKQLEGELKKLGVDCS